MHVFLETDRLWLRRITPADVDALTELDSDPAVMRYVNGGAPTPRAEVLELDLPYYLAFYEQSPRYGFWAAEAKADGAFLGWFLFRPSADLGPDEPELGYRLRRAAWGHGYATEGSRALIGHGFAAHGAQRVVAYACAANRDSWHVMEKLGMTRVRTLQETWPDRFGGLPQDVVEYHLSKAAWEQQEAARGVEPGPC
jgi:RimJ/RimL family protein N-acetyltransferase